MTLQEIKEAIDRELRIIAADCNEADNLDNPVGCDQLTVNAVDRLRDWVQTMAHVRRQFCTKV